MARSQAALKAGRSSLRKRLHNRIRLVAIDKLVRGIKHASQPSSEQVREFQKAIDKAASRGVLAKNRAARMKHRLLKQRATVSTAAEKRSGRQTRKPATRRKTAKK